MASLRLLHALIVPKDNNNVSVLPPPFKCKQTPARNARSRGEMRDSVSLYYAISGT